MKYYAEIILSTGIPQNMDESHKHKIQQIKHATKDACKNSIYINIRNR